MQRWSNTDGCRILGTTNTESKEFKLTARCSFVRAYRKPSAWLPGDIGIRVSRALSTGGPHVWKAPTSRAAAGIGI